MTNDNSKKGFWIAQTFHLLLLIFNIFSIYNFLNGNVSFIKISGIISLIEFLLDFFNGCKLSFLGVIICVISISILKNFKLGLFFGLTLSTVIFTIIGYVILIITTISLTKHTE